MRESNQQRMFQGIKAWQQSGLTQKAWCLQNNIGYSTFHYWYKRLRSEESLNGVDAGDNFIELAVAGVQSAAWCELSTPGGKRLIFHQSVNAEFLRSLID